MNKLTEDQRSRTRRLLDLSDPEPSMFINDISRLFGKLVSQDSPQDGVSHGFRRMFMILCARDGITQVELAKASNISSPSVSSALNKMEAEGLVKRVPDENDRRKVFVYITEKGRAQDDRIRQRFREVETIMMRGISSEEREALMATLRKMLCNMLEEEE